MRERTLLDLEYDIVLDRARAHSLSPEGRALLNGSAISTDDSIIAKRAEYIGLLMSLIDGADEMPTAFPSLSGLFDYVSRTHAAIEGGQIITVGEYLASLGTLQHFLRKDELVRETDLALSREIVNSLDEDGSVKDTHPEVAPYISRLERIKGDRFRYSQTFIGENSAITQNSNPVYRNERVAIPIRVDGKSQVPGYVQGASASGQTLFIEPFALVELNNQVVLAQGEIQKAKLRILTRLSEMVRSLLPYLKRVSSFVIDFDFHYSLARFAKDEHMHKVQRGAQLHLIDARHPLLGKKVVPINLTLDDNIRTVVLSGANAGGKTVTMKTVALMVLLAQTMGYIPAGEGSVLPLFDSVYTDIGDGQSIEAEESTFSSHMANVAEICRGAGPSSLVLLDELGSGTDPDEGSSLSIAIIESLSAKVGLTFTTSHYAAVKRCAYAHDNMLNASMEFIDEGARPTFHIIQGLPGDSHAIEIAAKMGIPKSIIDRAKDAHSSDENSISKIISDLKGKSRALDRKITESQIAVRNAEKKAKESEIEIENLKAQQLEVKEMRTDELSQFLTSARKEMEALVRAVQTGKLTREKTLSVRSFLDKVDNRNKEAKKELETVHEALIETGTHTYQVGDDVLCGSGQRRGTLLEDKGKGKWLVALDSLRMTLKESTFSPAPKERQVTIAPFKSSAPKPKLVLDVRGRTLAEAIAEVNDEIEGAVVHNLGQFSIIHGYGDGILSQGIHAYLKEQRSVKDFYFALPEDGGMGKTYVLLS